MADRVGQQLGNYQLIRLLGEGGFAEVYLGEHIHLGTEAAIKVLNTQLTSDDVDQFRNEARTIARLRHRHIVRVLDFGVEGKTPFLVMDYAPNGTLRQRYPRGTILPVTSVVSYVKQIAAALQFAHDQKLIHRDIKPENMLLEPNNDILLSDFGIALVAQSSRYQSTQDVVGTVAYMSPEQIQGKPRPASDQYSLAIVVYEWLGGDRPFHGSFTEMCTQHMFAAPPSLREKVPNILPDVEQVVMTALAKDPHQRFMSVQAFANALEQATQGEIPTALISSSSPQFRSSLPPTVLVTPQISQLQSRLPPTTLAPQPKVSQNLGNVICTYRGHSSEVNSIAWSLDGQRIASASNDDSTHVWDAFTGRSISTYHADSHNTQTRAVAWSPDGKYLASAISYGTVIVWDVATGTRICVYSGHSKGVNAVKWLYDGNSIVSGSDDKTVQVWNAFNGTQIHTYRGYSKVMKPVAWSSDAQRIAWISDNETETVQIRDGNMSRRGFTYRGHNAPVQVVAWSPNGTWIASAGYEDTGASYEAVVKVWDVNTGELKCTYRGHSFIVSSVVWSLDGQYIASASLDKAVHIWNAATGAGSYIYRGHSNLIQAIAWSPDGTRIASGGKDNTVQVWQTF